MSAGELLKQRKIVLWGQDEEGVEEEEAETEDYEDDIYVQ